MGDIVNLRRIRKRREREEASQRAAENRARHGRTKAERDRDFEVNAELASKLDRHRLDKEAE
jgi:hypothetical protein